MTRPGLVARRHEQQYVYEFSVRPCEHGGAKAAYELIRLKGDRAKMQFTEAMFVDFRSQIATVGLALVEIMRVPHFAPERVD